MFDNIKTKVIDELENRAIEELINKFCIRYVYPCYYDNGLCSNDNILLAFIYTLDPRKFAKAIQWDYDDLRKFVRRHKSVPYFIQDVKFGNIISYHITIDIQTFVQVDIEPVSKSRLLRPHQAIDPDTNVSVSMIIFGKNRNIVNERYKKFSTNMKKMNERYRKTNMYDLSQAYYDDAVTSIIKRDFTSIIIRKDIKDDLMMIVTNFMHTKKYFMNHSLLHKIGILLYGNPGTGKSSIVKAIASELDSEITTFDFTTTNSINNQIKNFNALLKSNEHNVILCVFEDIDYLFRKRENITDKKERNDANVIMNFIDGLTSPDGISVIFIATTNHIESLDPALIREGRFDFKFELGDFSEDLAKSFCDNMNISYDILDGEDYPINPAYLQSKIIKRKTNEINKLYKDKL